MKRAVNILVVLAILVVIGLVLRMNKKTTQQKTDLASSVTLEVPVQIDVVKEESFTTEFSSNGTLLPVKELALASDVSGRIVSILVDKGTWVKKGQVLISVDDEMLRADYLSSEAAYKALKTDYERFKNANEQGGVTNQQLDNLSTQLVSAESRYITSKRRLSDASIKSPIEGFINERYVEVGALLNPGARLFDIVDDSELKLHCNVTELQVLRLSRGQGVKISSRAFPMETFSGKISFISSKADRGLSYPVEISIKDKKGLKAGMYVTANFQSDAEKKGLLIPRNAVSGSVKSASVFVVKNGIAHHHDVVVGEMVGTKVQIVQGLQAGDSIVVAGLINVSDGVKVANKK